MEEQNENVTATEEMDTKTPHIDETELKNKKYIDADDELFSISEYLVDNYSHNDEVDVRRIKFFYSDKPFKDGDRFEIGKVVKRSDIEKMVNENFDFIVLVYYKAWKELDEKNKLIQMDRILSSIEPETVENTKPSIKKEDVKEHKKTLNAFGAKEVIESSEMVDLAIYRIKQEEKEKKKQQG